MDTVVDTHAYHQRQCQNADNIEFADQRVDAEHQEHANAQIEHGHQRQLRRAKTKPGHQQHEQRDDEARLFSLSQGHPGQFNAKLETARQARVDFAQFLDVLADGGIIV